MSPRNKLLLALLALIGVFIAGTLGYWVMIDSMTLGEAAYMTVITISTVGFSEIGDLGPAGRTWTAVIIVLGVLVVTMAFASLQAMIVSGEFRRVLGRRKLQDSIKKLNNHYIVCGFGRMGRLISIDLKSRGHNVVVVDMDDRRTAAAGELGLNYVLGDAASEATLREAGIDRAAGLVTVLRSDADNVFVTLTATGLREGVTVIARAEKITSDAKLRRAGAAHVVSPQDMGASRITNLLLRPAVAHVVDITMAGHEFEIEELTVQSGAPLEGRSLRDLRLREQSNVSVIAIRSAEGTIAVNPVPEHVVRGGDSLVIIGPAGSANDLIALARAKG